MAFKAYKIVGGLCERSWLWFSNLKISLPIKHIYGEIFHCELSVHVHACKRVLKSALVNKRQPNPTTASKRKIKNILQKGKQKIPWHGHEIQIPPFIFILTKSILLSSMSKNSTSLPSQCFYVQLNGLFSTWHWNWAQVVLGLKERILTSRSSICSSSVWLNRTYIFFSTAKPEDLY